jgi:hypothetical protein
MGLHELFISVMCLAAVAALAQQTQSVRQSHYLKSADNAPYQRFGGRVALNSDGSSAFVCSFAGSAASAVRHYSRLSSSAPYFLTQTIRPVFDLTVDTDFLKP